MSVDLGTCVACGEPPQPDVEIRILRREDRRSYVHVLCPALPVETESSEDAAAEEAAGAEAAEARAESPAGTLMFTYTHKGGRWHRDADCVALLHGQDVAWTRGAKPWRRITVPDHLRVKVVPDRSACNLCVPDDDPGRRG